jgi:hypothetical protein
VQNLIKPGAGFLIFVATESTENTENTEGKNRGRTISVYFRGARCPFTGWRLDVVAAIGQPA